MGSLLVRGPIEKLEGNREGQFSFSFSFAPDTPLCSAFLPLDGAPHSCASSSVHTGLTEVSVDAQAGVSLGFHAFLLGFSPAPKSRIRSGQHFRTQWHVFV